MLNAFLIEQQHRLRKCETCLADCGFSAVTLLNKLRQKV